MRRKPVWAIVTLAVVIIVIGWYLKTQQQLLSVFAHISLIKALYLVVLRLLFLVINGLVLREFALKFGIKLVMKEWLGLSMVTTMGNYITPFSGGMVVRAAYLKSRYKFSYAKFMALLASNYLIAFWTVGFVGIFTLLTLEQNKEYYWQILVFFILVVVSISILVLRPIAKLPWKNRLVETVNKSIEGWNLIKSDGQLLFRLMIYTLINIALNSASIWMAYAALGYPIFFRNALLVGLLTFFSLLIRITPGNLGIQEAIVSFSSGLFGFDTGLGLLAALLMRGCTLIWVFTFGPIFSFILTRELASFEEDG